MNNELEALEKLWYHAKEDLRPNKKLYVEYLDLYMKIKQSLLRLQSLEKFKATYDKYELVKKQDYVAFEIMEETLKREEEMKAKIKRYFELIAKDIKGSINVDELYEYRKLRKELKEWSEE